MYSDRMTNSETNKENIFILVASFQVTAQMHTSLSGFGYVTADANTICQDNSRSVHDKKNCAAITNIALSDTMKSPRNGRNTLCIAKHYGFTLKSQIPQIPQVLCHSSPGPAIGPRIHRLREKF